MKWLRIPYEQGVYFIPESAILDVFFESLEKEEALITFHGGGTTKATIIGGQDTYLKKLSGSGSVIDFKVSSGITKEN